MRLVDLALNRRPIRRRDTRTARRHDRRDAKDATSRPDPARALARPTRRLLDAQRACVLRRGLGPEHDTASRAVRWLAGRSPPTQWSTHSLRSHAQWRGLGFDVPPSTTTRSKHEPSPSSGPCAGTGWSAMASRSMFHAPRAAETGAARRRRGVRREHVAPHVHCLCAARRARRDDVGGVLCPSGPDCLIIERTLEVSSWPAPSARVWTIGILVATSPLFVGPLLRGFDAITSSTAGK